MNYAAWAVSGVKDGNSTATVSVVDLQSFNVRARVPPPNHVPFCCAHSLAHARPHTHGTRPGDTHVGVRGSSLGHRLARHLPDLRVFTSTSMPLET
jgi:hypothetical protein